MSEGTVIEMHHVEDSVMIAVTAEKINNLQRELAQHTVDDKEFQVKIFSFLQTSIEDLNTTVKSINTKLDTVWDDMTMRKGKKNLLETLGITTNAILTILISVGTTYIILKYGK